VKRNPALRSRQGKHHHEAGGTSVETIRRNDQCGSDAILLVATRWAEINGPDLAA
jgi:hypothetical protein